VEDFLFFAQRRSALLVDFENLYKQCGEEKFVRSIDNWLLWLEEGAFDSGGVRRNFLTKEVFWNTQHDIFRLEFQRRRFKPTVCRAIRKEKASSADFDITIRAAELRHEFKNIQEVVILSLDSDFSSVLYHLQLHDIAGVGMTDPNAQFAPNFRNIVDIVIDKPDFERAYEYQPRKRGWLGRTDAVVVPMPAKTETAPSTALGVAKPKAAVPPKTTDAKPAPQAIIRQKLDYAAAGALIAKHAEDNGLHLIGRERVRRLLQSLPGFRGANGGPWGGGSYRSVLQALVARNSRFSVEKREGGGFVLAFQLNERPRSVTS
jgi:hypothetical protein